MALNSVLMLAAGAGVLAQDPGMDMQFALPVRESAPVTQTAVGWTALSQFDVRQVANVAGIAFEATRAADATASKAGDYVFQFAPTQAPGQRPAQTRRVTAQFRNAPARDVLAWLEQQGVSFIVSDGVIPPDVRVTMNISDQPLADVTEALARSMGGHWQRQGEIRIFSKGLVPSMPAMPPLNIPGRDMMNARPGMPRMVPVPGMPGVPMQMMPPEMREQFEKLMSELRTREVGPDFAKRMEEWARQFESRFSTEWADRVRVQAEDQVLRARGMAAPVRSETRITLNTEQVKRLLDSLTPAQKTLMQNRGHLSWIDLTQEQQQLLGNRPQGRFEIEFREGDRKIIIRGN
jgi:hypothetical protein